MSNPTLEERLRDLEVCDDHTYFNDLCGKCKERREVAFFAVRLGEERMRERCAEIMEPIDESAAAVIRGIEVSFERKR